MDESAPATVATGTVITSVTGAAIAGTYAIAKGRGQAVATIFAASAALNCGIVGATFFGLREYAVKPALVSTLPFKQYARRRKILEASSSEPGSKVDLTWWDMRTHCLPDSMLSGGITGSVLNTWRRGSRGAVPGLVIGAVSCTLLQVLYNEVEVQRVKYVSRSLKAASLPPNPPKPSKASLGDRIMGLFGLQRMSDEEFVAKMKEDRNIYLKRIEELERQRAEEMEDGKS